MKQAVFYLIIAGIAFLCSCQNQPEASATDFYRDFNLGSLVEKMNLPKHQLRGSTVSAGSSVSGTDYRRNFILIYEIEEQNGERFDEEEFFNELKNEIAEKMDETGVRTGGAGYSDAIFYFNYSKDKNKGWVEVIGARLDGNRYKLWCVMREEARAKDD